MLLTYLQLIYGGQVIRIQNSEASDEKYIVFEYDEKTGLKYVIVLDELGKELFNSKENADRCGLEDITNDGNFGVYLVFLDRKLYCLFDATGRAYFPESKHNEPARYAEEIYQLNETNDTLLELVTYGDSEYLLKKPVSQVIDFSTGAILLETEAFGDSLLTFIKVDEETKEKSLYIYDTTTNKSIKYNYNKDKVDFVFEWDSLQDFLYKVRPLVHSENGSGDIEYYSDAADKQDENNSKSEELFADALNKVCIDNTYRLTRKVDKNKYYRACCNGLISVSDNFAFKNNITFAFKNGQEAKLKDLVDESAGDINNYGLWYNKDGSCVFIVITEDISTTLKSCSKAVKYSGNHTRTVLYAFKYDYNQGLKTSDGRNTGVDLVLKTGYTRVDYASDLTVVMAVDYDGKMQSYIVYKDNKYVYFVNSKTGLATMFSYNHNILGDFGVIEYGDIKTVIDCLDSYVAGGRLEENGEPEFDIKSIRFTDDYQIDCGIMRIEISSDTLDMKRQAMIKEIISGNSDCDSENLEEV